MYLILHWLFKCCHNDKFIDLLCLTDELIIAIKNGSSLKSIVKKNEVKTFNDYQSVFFSSKNCTPTAGTFVMKQLLRGSWLYYSKSKQIRVIYYGKQLKRFLKKINQLAMKRDITVSFVIQMLDNDMKGML